MPARKQGYRLWVSQEYDNNKLASQHAKMSIAQPVLIDFIDFCPTSPQEIGIA